MDKPEPFPTDVDELTALVKTLQTQVIEQTQFIDQLLEQIRLARHQHFGTRSERFSIDQLNVPFDRESAATEPADELRHTDAVPAPDNKHRRPRHRRSRRLPAQLPRVEIVHELAETDQFCGACQKPRKVIGQKVREQLDIQPASVRVIRHIQPTWCCSDCDDSPVTAALPRQPIPKSMATAGTLAHITVSKYGDGLPLYRQQRQWKRQGIELQRATLATWMIQCGQLVQPLINLLRERLLSYDIVAMDETVIQVLKELGKTPQSQSYLWVQRGGPPDSPIILFDYDPSRSQSVPLRLLEGYSGYLQVDGYEGYSKVIADNDLTALGCMAHARRKFDEALKAQGKMDPEKQKQTLAAVGLRQIQALYRIEREIRLLSVDQRYAIRQSRSKPLLQALRLWLDEKIPLVPPKSALGKALNYSDKQWDRLTVYIEDGRLRIDNNLTENAIRPFVVGRKAWLFCDTVAGARASANLYSLIETARANSIEPYAYMKQIYAGLPLAKNVGDIEKLLPIQPANTVAGYGT